MSKETVFVVWSKGTGKAKKFNNLRDMGREFTRSELENSDVQVLYGAVVVGNLEIEALVAELETAETK